MSEYVIELRDVSKRYRLFRQGRWRVLNVLGFPVPRSLYHDFWALREISLSVKNGQRVGIIGRNGAGKSSLLKLIAGLIRPTEGSVAVKGNVQTLLELGTGFHPEFTGRENVYAALALRGVTGADAQGRFGEIVEFAELEEFIDRPLKTYSSGMQARLAFSVATSFKPEILIIDEILSAGDAYFSGKCYERMGQLTRDHGATVLFVSHDLNSVQALCDRVIWLKRGCVFQDGDPLSVVKDYYQEVQMEENRRLRIVAQRFRGGEWISAGAQQDNVVHFKFCLVADGGLLENEGHKIREVRLCRESQVLSLIKVGSTNDSQQTMRGHLLAVQDGSWSRPFQDENGCFRLLTRSRDGVVRASFEVNCLNPTPHNDSPLTLEIHADVSASGDVWVELDEGAGRRRLGTLDPEQEWHRFEVGPDQPLLQGQKHKPSQVQNASDVMPTDEACDTLPGMRIEAVRFRNSKGEAVSGIEEGNDLVVEIEYDAAQPSINPVFAVSIYLLDGRTFCRAVSREDEVQAGSLIGKGKVRFLFYPFYGGPGEYVMTAEIFKRLHLKKPERPEVYDRHDRSYRFRVWKRLGTVLDLGLVAIPYTVEHLPPDATNQPKTHVATTQGET